MSDDQARQMVQIQEVQIHELQIHELLSYVGRLEAEVEKLKAENIRLQAEVEYQIDYTKKRGSQMLLDLAEINRLKAEIEQLNAKGDRVANDERRLHEAKINRVSDAWLSAYIIETKREGTECHPDRRFRVVMPRGGDQWFATHDEAREALLKAVMA